MQRPSEIARAREMAALADHNKFSFLVRYNGNGRSYFYDMEEGADVPPKWPDKESNPTSYDVLVCQLEQMGLRKEVSTLQAVNREWCHAVRKYRFKSLRLTPEVDRHRLSGVYCSNYVLPYVRHLSISGEWVSLPPQEDYFEHVWLSDLLPLIKAIGECSPVEYMTIENICWKGLTKDLRACLVDNFTHVRALDIYLINFENSNQLLRLLNSFPYVQYARMGDLVHATYTHVRSQLVRAEPLLLSELRLECGYTGLLMEWLLGQRVTLAIEELTLAVVDRYRDDARMARVIRRISPWLKVLKYLECNGYDGIPRWNCTRDDRDGSMLQEEREPWDPPLYGSRSIGRRYRLLPPWV
ncbi:hypothetical protein C8Q73DRAFT_308937 [Cubamyces lactineus]|nr:hypothetical protein C8Q73DRAFT_308937 [Cubamyces lactineus]